jgi:hypothetical protein
MPEVGVAMVEEPAAPLERVDDPFVHQYAADRLVTAAKTFGDRHQIGNDVLLLDRVQRAGAAHAAHHLIDDQQDAVAVADVTDAAEITRYRASNPRSHRRPFRRRTR